MQSSRLVSQAEECEKTGNETPKKSQIPIFFSPPALCGAAKAPSHAGQSPSFPSHPGFFRIPSHPSSGADVFPAGCDSRNAPQLFKSHSGSGSRENGRAGASLRADPSLPGQEIPRKAWKSHPAAALPCKKPFLEKLGKRHQILRFHPGGICRAHGKGAGMGFGKGRCSRLRASPG